ncbi:CAP family protein [Corallococcus terminator]|uniref:Serine protease n=1 Tax=Corallococcus terminator TaxID=2316733 RepID=A0A3A8HVL7_9BACT|nr:CAP family protein [Corallococcus terminator]RKG74476.1 serine protease [Corallococcus terminator]
MRTHRAVITLLLLLSASAFAREPFPDVTDTAFTNAVVTLHNSYRAKHSAPALTVDASIVAYAKTRAKTVSTFEGLSEGHRGLDHKYGENLYWAGSSTDGESSTRLANAAVSAWYGEIAKYSFKNGRFSADTGHFTQLVWKGTTKIGCAIARGKGSKWYETYVVCNYRAPGNMMGAFQTNVLPPK